MDYRTAIITLGMSEYWTPAEIREEYLDLVRVWHPDRFPPNSRVRRKAEDRLKKINEAYALLAAAGPATAAIAPASSAAHPVAQPTESQTPGTRTRAGRSKSSRHNSESRKVALACGLWALSLPFTVFLFAAYPFGQDLPSIPTATPTVCEPSAPNRAVDGTHELGGQDLRRP